MKKIFFKTIAIAGLTALLFSACKKQETEILATGGTAPVLTSSVAPTDTLTLTQPDSSNTEVVLNWTNPNYQFSDGISSQNVTYYIEFDTAGDNFTSKTIPITSVSSILNMSFTVLQLNNILINQLNATPLRAYTVQVRIVSSITPVTSGSAQALPLISNIANLIIVPYKSVKLYPATWVPGDYQGWSPPAAPTLAYGTTYNPTLSEGYINIPAGGTLQLKFTGEPDWNNSKLVYGEGGSDVTTGTTTTGKLSTSGGNVQLPAGGYYRFDVDTAGLNYTYDVVTWGVIGTFNGWATDVPMTYDVNRQLWYAVVPFDAAGSFKFRADADWSNPLHNFGLDASGNLSYGSSINVPGPVNAGNDSVFLDLHVPGNYSYNVQ